MSGKIMVLNADGSVWSDDYDSFQEAQYEADSLNQSQYPVFEKGKPFKAIQLPDES